MGLRFSHLLQLRFSTMRTSSKTISQDEPGGRLQSSLRGSLEAREIAGSVSTTSVQNKQPRAPNASNQNNQSTQTGVKKFSSPKRTLTRHSAAKDFSVWRQACFIMAPKTGSKKLQKHCGHKGLRLQETNWDAQREKA